MKKNRLLVLFSLFLFTSLSFAQTYVGPEKCLQCHNKVGLGDMTGCVHQCTQMVIQLY
ncbi:MAG: hypothetical protein PF445_12760 [Melioribacteraceae bacterium]|jgi:hypothetical protein|nr:hypothetical protein [Melioribacteraceae bacterium]